MGKFDSLTIGIVGFGLCECTGFIYLVVIRHHMNNVSESFDFFLISFAEFFRVTIVIFENKVINDNDEVF